MRIYDFDYKIFIKHYLIVLFVDKVKGFIFYFASVFCEYVYFYVIIVLLKTYKVDILLL
jgi:hypothetical protein